MYVIRFKKTITNFGMKKKEFKSLLSKPRINLNFLVFFSCAYLSPNFFYGNNKIFYYRNDNVTLLYIQRQL